MTGVAIGLDFPSSFITAAPFLNPFLLGHATPALSRIFCEGGRALGGWTICCRSPAAPPTRAKDKLQTAVRALKPQELFALQAENERLLKWEQELIEKAGFMKQQEERLVSLQEQLSLARHLRLQWKNAECRASRTWRSSGYAR